MKNKDKQEEKQQSSRVSRAVFSLILPGLGQIIRGRIFAGLFFLLNVIIYGIPLFITHNVDFDVRTPSLLIVLGVWVCSVLDAFMQKSSFLVMSLLVSLLFFGTGFFSAFFLLPYLDV